MKMTMVAALMVRLSLQEHKCTRMLGGRTCDKFRMQAKLPENGLSHLLEMAQHHCIVHEKSFHFWILPMEGYSPSFEATTTATSM